MQHLHQALINLLKDSLVLSEIMPNSIIYIRYL